MTPILEIQNLSHIYSPDTPFEHPALTNVDLTIGRGEFVGLIGHTGSGKSTLVQHMNGLLKPTSGRVLFDGRDIWEDPKFTRQIRFHVGLVFQYPEYQLFEETVYADIAFGPKNMGLSKDEIDARVRRAASFVGISEAELSKSPFDLSGGQKRRAAIAGVIAMEPDVLILDEPTAGLDPKERIRIRNLISDLSQDRIVLIATHVVSDIEFISKEILLMKNGRLIDKASPEQLQAKIQGKVFEMSVGQQELEEVKEKFEISNLFRKDGQIIVRVVTQKRPEGYDEIREAAPTLEDVYLYEFEVKGAMHNNAVRKIAGT